MKKVVIFDLDGTILDTLTDLKNSVNYVLEKNNFSLKSTEQIRTYVGNGIEKLMRRALPEDMSEEDFQKNYKMFKEHYEANIQNETKPYPGIIELLMDLINQGVLIAVVSNKFQAGVDKLVSDFFGDLINIAVGTSEVIRPKPEVDAINFVFEKLYLKDDDEVYFVGDSEVDIQTARNANLPVISVTWGFRDRAELEIHNPNYLVDESNQVFQIIKNNK